MTTKPKRPAARPKRPKYRATGHAAAPPRAANGTQPRSAGATQPRSYAESGLAAGNYRRIARSAGYAPQHVSRVLRGLKGCTLDAAVRIADAAGVSLDDLRAHIEQARKVA